MLFAVLAGRYELVASFDCGRLAQRHDRQHSAFGAGIVDGGHQEDEGEAADGPELDTSVGYDTESETKQGSPTV